MGTGGGEMRNGERGWRTRKGGWETEGERRLATREKGREMQERGETNLERRGWEKILECSLSLTLSSHNLYILCPIVIQTLCRQPVSIRQAKNSEGIGNGEGGDKLRMARGPGPARGKPRTASGSDSGMARGKRREGKRRGERTWERQGEEGSLRLGS